MSNNEHRIPIGNSELSYFIDYREYNDEEDNDNRPGREKTRTLDLC